MIRRATALLSLLIFIAQPALANWCAIPGRNGSATLSGIVNTYFPATASASAGATSIRIGPSRGAAQTITAGDLLLVIQMQDAQINSSNNSRYGDGVNGGDGAGYSNIRQSGRYEFVRATNAVGSNGGTLTIQGATGGGLVNAYAYASTTSSQRRTFQVIRVPQHTDATIAGTVTAAEWDGTSGGVAAIDVAGRLTFSGGTINVAGLGFRGGSGRDMGGGSGSNTAYRFASDSGWGASKGEGVAGTPRYVLIGNQLEDNGVEGLPNGSYGRGAPGNAGGGGNDGEPDFNNQNAGGGGGGNGGAGGLGGHAWCSTAPSGCPQVGGYGGTEIFEIGVDRAILGGGGGAGSTNDATGSPASGLASSGAAGGGIVFIRAGEIAGTGTINANGAAANSTVANDASGGGGAGGSILIAAVRQVNGTALAIQARGGNGGSNTGGGAAHGPGGGGGGGFVATTFAVTANVSGGSAGSTANGGAFGASYGAIGGNGGNGITISGADIPGMSSGGECTPTIAKAFPTSPTSPGVPTPLAITVTNNNPTQPLTAIAFTDTYPAGLSNAAPPSPAKSCATAATLSAAAGGNSFQVAGGIIAAGGNCTYSVNTLVGDYNSRTNTIAAGGLTGSYNVAVASLSPATATLTVAPPLTIVKYSQPQSDPANGVTNAKNIPGSLVAYTIAVTNPAPYTVTNGSIAIIDATPANLSLFVGNAASGTGPVVFNQGTPTSALSLSFAGLASMTDDVDFSNDGGASWSYVPSVGTSGTDASVTHIRLRPQGAMAPMSNFSITLGYLVR